MSEFTTIQITKDLKQKLDLMKGEKNIKYNDLIENLLQQAGGTYVDDVITITRDTTALSLKYWQTEGPTNTMFYDITFQELKVEPVGTVFSANPKPNKNVDFVNSTAEICFKSGDDVLLLVKEISCTDGVVNSMASVVHINLF